jgi:rhodanese-related sulfurtransferase
MVRDDFPEITQLGTSELASWLADPDREPPVILDTREPDEYAVSHLPGAIQVSPGSDPAKTLADLPKDSPVVVYCSVGYRSSRYARKMERAGFTNVVNLEGSIFLWANEGRPLETGPGKPGNRVHPYDSKWGQLLSPEIRKNSGEK